MALKYGFYNSINNDRKYDAEDMSIFMEGLVEDGVLRTFGDLFKVTASGTNVVVGTGKAWFAKTWTYNDANLSIPILPANIANDRIDRLVLEINKNLSVRENSIKWVEGVPAASPTPPSLINNENVKQYSLSQVRRVTDSTTITSANITDEVGTVYCPLASSGLKSTDAKQILEEKRSTTRGNNLGSSFTTAQRNAIKNGSFDDLYLGDYWLYNGVKWRIVDFDYWYGQRGTSSLTNLTTNARITDHHLVIVPDDVRTITGPTYRVLTTSESAISDQYCGVGVYDMPIPTMDSVIVYDIIRNILVQSHGLFSESRIVRRRPYLPTGMASGGLYMDRVVSKNKWFATPMNESQITGVTSTTTKLTVGAETRQFSYYKLDQRNIWPEGVVYPFWLLTNWSKSRTNCFHDWELSSTDANFRINGGQIFNLNGGSHYERPVFGVTGI